MTRSWFEPTNAEFWRVATGSTALSRRRELLHRGNEVERLRTDRLVFDTEPVRPERRRRLGRREPLVERRPVLAAAGGGPVHDDETAVSAEYPVDLGERVVARELVVGHRRERGVDGPGVEGQITHFGRQEFDVLRDALSR